MISLFQGASADDVWQQVAQAFRQSDGVATQNGRGGLTREILHAAISVEDTRQRWAVSRRPALNPALALAEVVWDHDRAQRPGILGILDQGVQKVRWGRARATRGIRLSHTPPSLYRPVGPSLPESYQANPTLGKLSFKSGTPRPTCRTWMGPRSMTTSRATSCRCPRSETVGLSGCR